MAAQQDKKLTIIAYKDENFSTKVADPNQWVAPVNPDQFSRNHTTSLHTPSTTDSGKKPTRSGGIDPQVLSFDLYIDATGVITKNTDVVAEIKKFKKVTCSFNGTIHTPNYLILIWSSAFTDDKPGKSVFKCRLTKLAINYTLFKPDGTPLRAKLTPTFQEFLSDKTIDLEENASSPDLTHVRTVKAGDTLPLMCYDIYRDSRFYLEVARVNGLKQFRYLEPGTRITFPPLEK